MRAISKNKLELGDTLLPDLFILNYLQLMQGSDLKVYIYLLFLSKKNIDIEPKDLSIRLNISEQELSFSLDRLETDGLIVKAEHGFNIVDIKESEINKSFIPKIEPEKTKAQTEQDKKRIAAATAINESFFQGVMSFSWYTDIGQIFDKYMFSEEVMIALFHYCQERKALNRKYVYAVAETWHKGGVKTFEQLEEYLGSIDKMHTIEQKISKTLRLNRNITEYEEKYIDKWIKEYNYDFSMIEEALKRTVSVASPSIRYVNGILKRWHEKGYKTVEDLKNDKKTSSSNSTNKNTTNAKKSANYKNYQQRNYDDLDAYYDNIK